MATRGRGPVAPHDFGLRRSNQNLIEPQSNCDGPWHPDRRDAKSAVFIVGGYVYRNVKTTSAIRIDGNLDRSVFCWAKRSRLAVKPPARDLAGAAAA